MQPSVENATIEKMGPASALSSTKNKSEAFSYLYIMFYRHGMNANLTKGFYHSGDLMSARRRAEAHCKIMGYKFIFVRPMVCDLEVEEEYKIKGLEALEG